jgi:hypothetical protein
MSQETKKPDKKAVSDNTIGEHEAIAAAEQRLEAALVRPASGVEREWASRVVAEIKPLQDLLRSHCETSEGPDGLLLEIEDTTLIMNERLVDVKRHHKVLLDQCAGLLAEAKRCAAGEPVQPRDVRRRAASLMSEILHHHGIEADMMFEAFMSDFGGVD